MTAKWEKQSGSLGVLTYEAPAEAFDKAVDQAFKKVVKTLNTPGFRKGKMPRAMFNKMYGEEALYQDALDILYQDTIEGAVVESGIEPIALENIDVETLEKGKPVEFKITFVIEPEATLGEYKGLEYTAVETDVTDEDVDAELKTMQERGAELVVKEDGVIENGDTVVFDFAGFDGDNQFDGGTAENYSLVIGSGNFIPGFEEQMVGLKTGEQKDIDVTFPEEYHEASLAGKPVVFKVTIHEVKAQELPELTDEFAKEMDEEVASLDELKTKIRTRLENTRKQEADASMRDELVEAATKNATVDLPAVMVDNEVERMVQEFTQRIQSQGIDLDMYFQLTGTTEEAMRTEMKEQAEERVKARLVLKQIVADENIEVNEEEAQAELQSMSELYNIPADQLETMLAPQGGLDTLKGDLQFRKAIDVLVDNAKTK